MAYISEDCAYTWRLCTTETRSRTPGALQPLLHDEARLLAFEFLGLIPFLQC